MKKTLAIKTFLAALLCGVVCASDDMFVNPNCEVTRPARILPSVQPIEDSLVLPGDIPIRPPRLVQTEDGKLVQVNFVTVTRAQQGSRPQGQSSQPRPQGQSSQPRPGTQANQSRSPGQSNQSAAPAPPPSELPQRYREFNAMSEAERLASLRSSIETVMAANVRRGVNTDTNSPNEIMLMALPYGADSRVYVPNPAAARHNPNVRNAGPPPVGNHIYSIGALAWNTPSNGRTLLRSDGSKVIARVGFGYQQRPAYFAAVLAMSNIMPTYELRVDGTSHTIAHLIASEKASLSRGMDMSMALVAFSFYGDPEAQWKNELDEVWSIERMVINELNRHQQLQIDQGTSEVTDWLLGLTAAVTMYESENIPIRGPIALARRQLQTYQEFVLSIQNDRYLWHPRFFLYKGFNPNAFETMYSGGHVLRWLAVSLPDKELRDPRVMRAVMSLAATVDRVRPETTASQLTPRQLEGLAVSLHALSLYYQRVFGGDPMNPRGRSVAGVVETEPQS